MVKIIVSNGVRIADKLVLSNEDVCVEQHRFYDIKDDCRSSDFVVEKFFMSVIGNIVVNVSESRIL